MTKNLTMFLAGLLVALGAVACASQSPGPPGGSSSRDTVALTDASDDVAALQSQVDDLTNQVDDLDQRITDLEDAVTTLQDDTGPGGSLDSRLSDAESNVSELCGWMRLNADGFFGC